MKTTVWDETSRSSAGFRRSAPGQLTHQRGRQPRPGIRGKGGGKQCRTPKHMLLRKTQIDQNAGPQKWLLVCGEMGLLQRLGWKKWRRSTEGNQTDFAAAGWSRGSQKPCCVLVGEKQRVRVSVICCFLAWRASKPGPVGQNTSFPMMCQVKSQLRFSLEWIGQTSPNFLLAKVVFPISRKSSGSEGKSVQLPA